MKEKKGHKKIIDIVSYDLKMCVKLKGCNMCARNLFQVINHISTDLYVTTYMS